MLTAHSIVIKRLIALFFLLSHDAFSNSDMQSVAEQNIEIRVGSLATATHFQNQYFYELLALCLTKTTAEYGDFKISYSEKLNVQARSIKMLSEGNKIDILHTMTSEERESSLSFIKVDLLKGLLGQRVFVIKKSEQARFRHISREQLQTYTAVQGIDWPDLRIMEDNGFHVVGSLFTSRMFDMIRKKRADYFPRSIFEVSEEALIFEKQGLIIEPTLAFEYQAPVYFFFHPANTELRQRIEQGLAKAQQDGSFDALFNRFFARNLALLENRTIFYLNTGTKMGININQR